MEFHNSIVFGSEQFNYGNVDQSSILLRSKLTATLIGSADLFEDEVVAEILSYQPWWNGDNDATFSEQEKETMQGFPNKEYLLDEAETKWVLLGECQTIVINKHSFKCRFSSLHFMGS